MRDVDLQLLLEMNQPVPRYTSYPTAPAWGDFSPTQYEDKLKLVAKNKEPLSLYVHIPFCRTMCLYCACSVVLNRKKEREDEYVRALLQEIALVSSHIGKENEVIQLHFGGGTPTQLSIEELSKLFDKLHASFQMDKAKEIAIEIDPRTVHEDGGKKLKELQALGFNRVSFGVQDVDPKVQEAVKRRQSLEVTQDTYYKARELQFESINIDLIYGLPFQTESSFSHTVDAILELRPDRIALFSYAQVPHLKPHQKAIREEWLPSTEEKFRIYLLARRRFVEAGYKAIGMDHFALPDDELARGYLNKTLHRNFQGYTVFEAENLLPLGMTSIGYVEGAFVQNAKDLEEYMQKMDQGILAVKRGKELSLDDHIRRYTILSLMCHFEVDKLEFEKRFEISFDSYFEKELHQLSTFYERGFLQESSSKLLVTPLGELFIRNIASNFDSYLNTLSTPFSKAI